MEREHLVAFNKKGIKTGIYPKNKKLPVGPHLTTETEAIDSMSFNLAMVLVIYLFAYLLPRLITFLLAFAGKAAGEPAVNLWGISFIFAALVALLVKNVLQALEYDHILDNGTLTRISGSSLDIMVTGAIAAISIVIVARYWAPILIMSILAGFITIVTVPWLCSRLFKDHRFHRTLIIFGVSTEILPTGLALLRVIDPDFETPVASDYMYSCGLTFVLAIPFILSINLSKKRTTRALPMSGSGRIRRSPDLLIHECYENEFVFRKGYPRWAILNKRLAPNPGTPLRNR